jgi:CheY-like chemotaxis protein
MNITQNLIRMMNGKILVESELGKGSLFTIRLPQGTVGAKPLGKELTEKLKQFRSSYEAKMKKAYVVRQDKLLGKVLVVDDMDMNLYVAKGMMSPYGIQIDTALSGFDAIEKIKNNAYDLVFMDHMMPKMDGIETTQEIRKLGQEYENLPIIALTANAVAGMKEMFLSSGFNGFISKPIVIQELDAVLKEWLPRREVTQGIEPETPETADTGAYDIILDGVSAIDEINMELGLSRFSGDKDMYCNTLDMFYKNLPAACDNMTAFLEAKNLKDFMIIVHSIKSQLATIGAMRLSETASDLETASNNQETELCERQFPAFKEKLLSLHWHLSEIFPGGEALPKKGPGDKGLLRENAQKALAAIEDFDSDTGIEIIKNLLPYDFGGEINVLLENTLAALENFEYEGAVEILRKLE